MKLGRSLLLLALVLGVAAPVEAAKPAKEDLAEQVRKSIDKAKKFLREQQIANGDQGDWELDIECKARGPAGETCLALLALLYAGENPKAEVIQRGLRFLRTLKPGKTYVVALQAMVFAQAGFPQDLARIQDNVNWLLKARVGSVKNLRGWGYGGSGQGMPDNSNTQYALLGLWAGKSAGATIARADWESIRDYYVRTQEDDGGWRYRPEYPGTTPSMTTAGLCGLLITGQELAGDDQQLQPNGVAKRCGVYPENAPLLKATDWLARNFTIDRVRMGVFYNIYGIERAGRLSGQRFFGDHDWYREGCRFLIDNQLDNGSWVINGQLHDTWPVVSTSFALLFLSKGRTPMLISKLVHGSPDNPTLDWNRKHNDIRHLTDYASQQLFKRQPLGWQVFNARQAPHDTDEQIRTLVGDLLPSPIAYVSGHNKPFFTAWEKKLLREYIEQGGFLLAEACCGSPAFDAGFRELMKELFPDTPLKPLAATHPIFRGPPVLNARDFKLEGIELGCKTVVVYTPQPISGWWEANQVGDGRGKQVFQLGANIVAYATGLEMPKPKGFRDEVPSAREETKTPRGYLQLVQLRTGDRWRSAANGIRNLMLDLRKNARLDVALKSVELFADDRDIINYKLLYMHGRDEFDIKNAALLKANLESGALLFADACCGNKEFDKSFRRLIKQMFNRDLEKIPPGDDLFSKDLNGTAITAVRLRREHDAGETAAGYTAGEPKELEGIKIGNRWAVIYSRYDIGCALEKHQSSDCLGYDHASALRLAGAAVLYALQR